MTLNMTFDSPRLVHSPIQQPCPFINEVLLLHPLAPTPPSYHPPPLPLPSFPFNNVLFSSTHHLTILIFLHLWPVVLLTSLNSVHPSLTPPVYFQLRYNTSSLPLRWISTSPPSLHSSTHPSIAVPSWQAYRPIWIRFVSHWNITDKK